MSSPMPLESARLGARETIRPANGDPVAQRSVPQQRRLNAMDQAMLSVNRELRSLGHPGFETQMLVWLRSRVDASRLERSIERLAGRFPVVTSRLVEPDHDTPYWEFRKAARCPLIVSRLECSQDQAAFDFAAALLSERRDLTRDHPISFHLLRRPDGRDVFVVQFNHALMDNNAAPEILRELDAPPAADNEDLGLPESELREPLAAYLGRFPWKRRLSSAARVLDLRFRKLRGTPLQLGQHAGVAGPSGAVRLAARTIEPDDVEELRSRAVHSCGFPAISMAVLASVFRSLCKVQRESTSRRDRLIAGIGVDLGLRRRSRPIFQNLVSLVPIAAQRTELCDRENLIRKLHEQMRTSLTRGADLGFIQLADVAGRSRRALRWSTNRLLTKGYSMWYAYFSAVDDIPDPFCGVPVEKCCFTGPAWPPLGLTLVVNRFRGRLLLQATSLPDVVSPQTVDAFLDAAVDDLLRRT